MSDVSVLAHQLDRQRRRRLLLTAVLSCAVIAGIALDTHVVRTDAAGQTQQGFSPDSWAEQHFPEVKQSVERRAVAAQTLAAALQANQQAAAAQYGVGSPLPVIPVRLEGVVQPGEKGIFPLQVAGVPESLKVRLQTGPALSGTDLRDASGTIQFGDFTNQIEYQNAGAALNRAIKKSVLEKLDRNALPGKTVEVIGVFRLLNASNWLITPVSVEVK
ncbi:DUF2291 family protein [Pantoea eucrina]|uniref:DUF2291 family protein n=1 Tax=Pantoea eucrina TaxID=472693 RepID=A0ABS1Z177_9GAMM|nr:DUF2291 family protein [Pantoea eucrina]AIX51161.1 hypothetical protein PSNIH1_13460 [Pantoea sp. PSNIH1]MBM0746151.1 DUF2291 family protein [Pantoea eucrina]UBB14630.1 DUF2291 domain-containing protein [Pantoea eucrina]